MAWGRASTRGPGYSTGPTPNVSIDVRRLRAALRNGFTVLEPVADGPNNKVIQPSMRFGRDVHAMMLRDTAMRVSDYYGRDGYIDIDLAGLNLATMPKVLIETGNMNNAADAALLVRPAVQRAIAAALAAAIAGSWPGASRIRLTGPAAEQLPDPRRQVDRGVAERHVGVPPDRVT